MRAIALIPALIFIFSITLIVRTVYVLTSNSDEHLIQDGNGTVSEEDKDYVVICDAGSSGTRLYVYSYFKHRNPYPDVLNISIHRVDNEPVVMKIEPGLSSFESNPDGVIDYIKPLLTFAEEKIPAEKISTTPLFIYATAGMRLMPYSPRVKIIRKLRSELSAHTNLMVSDSRISVIDGNWEGIYNWISVNYVLGNLNPIAKQINGIWKTHRKSTVGMIDMGGASVQIAYEMPIDDKFVSKDVIDINLGPDDEDESLKYKLFSSTFLGFGANEALTKYYESLLDPIPVDDEDKSSEVTSPPTTEKPQSSDLSENETVPRFNDSCFPVGYKKIIELDDGRKLNTTGTGNWEDCNRQLIQVMERNKTHRCGFNRCYMKSVMAPYVNLSTTEMYGFSEYWYTTNDIFNMGGQFNYKKFETKAKHYCGESWDNLKRDFEYKKYGSIDINRLAKNCFKSAWISAVLHEGFSIEREINKFQTTNTIQGEEVQWALGAVIYQMKDAGYISIQNEANMSNTMSVLLIFIILALIIVGIATILRLKSDPWNTIKVYVTNKKMECFKSNSQMA